MEERLQKVLARRGIASRRHSEEMMRSGRILVNGQTVWQPGMKVDAERDQITVDGKQIVQDESKKYLMLHKPCGYVSTVTDPQGRPTVLDLLPDDLGRIYPVGRLDKETSGLLLLTNDGEFAQKMLHPSKEIEKTYEAVVIGQVGPKQIQALREGVLLEDGPTAPAKVSVKRTLADKTVLALTIHEGRNRQVRHMLEAVGLRLHALHRSRFSFFTLTGLPLGKWRYLTEREIARCQQL